MTMLDEAAAAKASEIALIEAVTTVSTVAAPETTDASGGVPHAFVFDYRITGVRCAHCYRLIPRPDGPTEPIVCCEYSYAWEPKGQRPKRYGGRR